MLGRGKARPPPRLRRSKRAHQRGDPHQPELTRAHEGCGSVRAAVLHLLQHVGEAPCHHEAT
eukprot:15433846-Alexandrium_andersonii.AAC.1